MVGGAVRNALLEVPIGDIDIATTALPERGDPPRQGGRHQERADRHRARHGDAGGRRPAVRSHDAARGHRNLRPQGQSGLRPRLGRRRRRRDFTIKALRSAPTAWCTIMSAGSMTLRQAACASSARRRRGSRRTTCAFCASSASTPPSARASRIAPATSPASARVRDLPMLSAERMRMEILKLLVADGAAGAVTAMADGGLAADGFRRRHLHRDLCGDDRGRAHARTEGGRDAPARRARCRRHRGRKAALRCGCGSPTPRPRRWIRWAIAGGGLPAWTRRRARRRLYRLGESATAIG